MPAPGCSPGEALRYTRWLAASHYENFRIASWLLPRPLRQHFYNVYAYCRWADDLADEAGDPERALELLDDWGRQLRECYAGAASHPVFIALAQTIRACDIPAEPFADLLVAFRQDQTVTRYADWAGVLGYCRYSANPVGRLVLYLNGYRDAERQQLSDATCTALQLANFWQDVSRDLRNGRIYIPLGALANHGLTEGDLHAARFDERYVSLMKDLIARTRALFEQGSPLVARVEPGLRVDIEMFTRGGLAVLESIEALGYNTLEHRPVVSRARQAGLLARTLWRHRLGGAAAAAPADIPVVAPAGLPAAEPDSATEHSAGGPTWQAGPNVTSGADVEVPPGIAKSYAECRRMARAAGSNFYYAFFMLPPGKRDALCALYAFMRLVDDVADTPAPLAEKQRGLARWRAALDAACAGEVLGHPILPALADAIHTFRIPPRYFHDLISGAEMDLTVADYATFERLREYCYRVAGTVGLTCLHVFGYEDPHAPDLAEKLGIAFQLTNILRDVSKDYEMGRIYLPREELDRFGVRPADLARGPLSPALRALLAFQGERARELSREAVPLIACVHRDSRAALWALARIYRGLLRRIEQRGYDVLSGRVRLSAPEKTAILLRAKFGWYSQQNVIEKSDRDRRGPGGTVLGRRAG